MALQELNKVKAKNLIDKLSRIQSIRRQALEILIKVDAEASDYKLNMLKKKLGDFIK